MQAIDFLKLYCQAINISKEQLTAKSRKETLIEDRKNYYIIGSEMGFSDTELASLLGQERTTSIHHRNAKRNQRWIDEVKDRINNMNKPFSLKERIHVVMDNEEDDVVIVLDGVKFTTKASETVVMEVYNKILNLNKYIKNEK